MPTSEMKVKSGNSYEVKYRVEGSLDSLTPDQLKNLAERQLRASARAYVLGNLQTVEPEIATYRGMFKAMLESGLGNEETVTAFFKAQNFNLDVPTEFVIPIADLIPDGTSGRGKKAANIFSFEGDEAEAETETPVAE